MDAFGRSTLRRRSLWAAALAVAYTAFAALRASDGRGPAWLALILGPALLLLAFERLESTEVDDERRAPARSAARAVATGVVLAGVALSAASALVRDSGLVVGAALATLGALRAVQRMPSEGGLLAPPRDSASPGVLVVLGLAHAAALSARAAVHLELAVAGRTAAEALGTGASLFGGGLVVVAALRARVDRRLELGLAERAGATLQVGAVAMLAGIGAAAFGVVRPAVALPLAAIVTSSVAAAAGVTREPAAVRDAGRVVFALLLAAVPPALGAAWVARREPRAAAVAALVATLAAAAAGLAAPLLARLVAPERTRRERALQAAAEAALHPEPAVAIERALLALRAQGGPRLAETALYRVAPPELLRVDRAGYVQTEHAEVPPTLLALAEAEPLGIARADALRAAEVRRPDVRPLGAWLADRRIGAAIVVHDESGVAALLAVPPGPRGAGVELDEARALRRLADRLGAAAAAGSAMGRSLEREAELRRAAAARADEVQVVRAALARSTRHLEAAAAVLARPARVAAYGPASRGALEQVERLGETSVAVTLLVPPGADATAWAAVWHLASPRRDAAFVVVDGVDTAREPLAWWRDPATSPIEAAASGSLCVLDPQALPLDVQSFLGASAERAALIVAVPRTVSALVGAGQLHERLADHLGDRAVAIPPLAARAEDLRGLVHEHLTRAGLRLRGAPLAVDPGALAELVEHTWPGNDVELAATLTRAALAAKGTTITRDDLTAIGFRPEAPRARSGASTRPARRR